MPVLGVPCQREIPEGKFEQTHLQDVQISTETRNLASLSEMMIAVFSFFTSHAFYSFSWDTISYFTTFPHCISTGNVNTFQDSTAAFFWERSHKHLLSSVTAGEAQTTWGSAPWRSDADRDSPDGEPCTMGPSRMSSTSHPGICSSSQGDELLWDQQWQSDGLEMEKAGVLVNSTEGENECHCLGCWKR